VGSGPGSNSREHRWSATDLCEHHLTVSARFVRVGENVRAAIDPHNVARDEYFPVHSAPVLGVGSERIGLSVVSKNDRVTGARAVDEDEAADDGISAAGSAHVTDRCARPDEVQSGFVGRHRVRGQDGPVVVDCGGG
jgi:hypothetical protein